MMQSKRPFGFFSLVPVMNLHTFQVGPFLFIYLLIYSLIIYFFYTYICIEV